MAKILSGLKGAILVHGPHEQEVLAGGVRHRDDPPFGIAGYLQ